MAANRMVSPLNRDSLKGLRKDRQRQTRVAARFLRSARVDLSAAYNINYSLSREL